MANLAGPAGLVSKIVGTVAVVVGAFVMIGSWDTVNAWQGLILAAVLIIGGLLLRIEGAVAASARREPPRDDRPY